ncbi:MAG: hypothetical protein BA867_07580 [Desulfobacterales bacterium S5133MH16]|nr:MAG: hypothetical protein BA867_07580 [Desulfobacterales bacterium S5133MH16]
MGKISSAIEKSNRENWSTSINKKSETDPPPPNITTFKEFGLLRKNRNIDKGLIALLKPDSFEAEQFRKLGTTLLYAGSETKPRCFLVTSVASGEGKTFVAANLAISIAQNLEENVLLIDCDLRAPSVHARFGMHGVNGISEHFLKGIDILPLIQKTPVKNLTVLPAGGTSLESAKLLSSQRMSKALDLLKAGQENQFIFIDAPPPLLTAETAALAKYVDGIILVIQYGSTPRDMVAELIKYIGKEKIAGIVLNRYKMKRAGYYKYGYGSA